MMEASCTRFTAPEGGARLLATASAQNTLTVEYASFISTRLIYEGAYKIRGALSSGKQRSIYICRASRVKFVGYELDILTDLSILEGIECTDVDDWGAALETKEVLVCTSVVFKQLLEDQVLSMANINIMVIDSCHLIYKDDNLKYIMNLYKIADEDKRPRILALTYPLFTANRLDTKSKNKTIDNKDTATIDSKEASNNDEEKDLVEKEEESEEIKRIDNVIDSKESQDIPKLEDSEKFVNDTENNDDEVGLYENLDDFEMYEKLEWKIEELERALCCKMDLAEDIDGGKRNSSVITKPNELIIEYSPQWNGNEVTDDFKELYQYMRDTVNEALEFLHDHRYDPTEIYGEEMFEEFKNIPNPTIEPKQIFKQFSYVLDELGPYGADKAAFSLLSKLEKLKIKVPYERHFLLLCLCTSVFVKIRCYSDIILSKYTDYDKIRLFSTPKVLRLAEILEKFQPPENQKYTNDFREKNDDDEIKTDDVNIEKLNTNQESNKTKQMLDEIDGCDFVSLKNKIEDKINIFNANLKDIDTDLDNEKNVHFDRSKPEILHNGFSRRAGNKGRGRGRSQRSNASRLQQNALNPDALCGIVFMKEAFMTKIMFLVIVDMSRSNPKLSFVCTQYCCVENSLAADTQRRQEEVLKKFRMHECNLLLTTAALEEGIDLPRCNLVLRWDLPNSYRSYSLCRSRARAARCACVVLCPQHTSASPTTHTAHTNPSTTHGGMDTLHCVATYRQLDQIITKNCGCGAQNEPPQSEEDHADAFTSLIKPYSPIDAIDKCQNDVLKKPDENDVPEDVKKLKTDVKCACVNGCVCVKSDSVFDSRCRSEKEEWPSVDLSTAIALINRYCGKLPSDTFTRLAPQWTMEEVNLPSSSDDGQSKTAYICTLRLPLNCPVNYNIVGHPMPTRVLARRMVALQACRILHMSGELDDQLMPIGKENFKTSELDCSLGASDDNDSAAPRPGTTKRRQYYYKKTAWAFTDCEPLIDTTDAEIERDKTLGANGGKEREKKEVPEGTKRNMLYAIVSSLCCALPERYNTRGRRLHAPQHASQAIGILMSRHEPTDLQIPAFPVYTRSGEVRVCVTRVSDADVRLSPSRARLVRRFMRFVFAEVLRVRRRGMRLRGTKLRRNDYYVVPTIKSTRPDGSTKIDVDWAFLELIYQHTEEKKLAEIEKPVLWPAEDDDDEDKEGDPDKKEKEEVKEMKNPLLKEGEVFVFDEEKYKEAVVTPWYRNQDQPQFFLVAEICRQLSPDSAFPSAAQQMSFRAYYLRKYACRLTQAHQPLLDVDHTSARLNLLTPRYVNRKGVALPVSSERTRRAKRDRLDQKQILVPELCRVHPFAAPLWFATVALPCVLYRINALLIADEIRRSVALDVGLGIPQLDATSCPGFQWPPLHFGWSLAEVLNADEKSEKKKEIEDKMKEEEDETKDSVKIEEDNSTKEEPKEQKEKTINDILQEKHDAESGFEIGTWSNDMASSIPDSMDYDEYMEPLPSNLTFCTSASGGTNWCDNIKEKPKSQYNPTKNFSMADSDCSYISSSDFDSDDSDLNSDVSEDTDTSGFCSSKNSNAAMGVRIEYKTAHEAEAVDLEQKSAKVCLSPRVSETDDALDREEWLRYISEGDAPIEYIEKFRNSVEQHKKEIIENGQLITENSSISELLSETREGRTNADSTFGMSKIVINDTNGDHVKTVERTKELFNNMFPYKNDELKMVNGQIDLKSLERNKRVLLNELKMTIDTENMTKLSCFSMKDIDIDSPDYVNEKIANVGFDKKEVYEEKLREGVHREFTPYYMDSKGANGKEFDFDAQPDLNGHPGPSPSVILQALTMSNANDGINLERLETIGDSFLKFAITAHLYCALPAVHEGKLSHVRSKQVSNLNLYRLGRGRRLGTRMIASKFEPHDNWLPPCHRAPEPRRPAVEKTEATMENADCFIPYNLITQHSIPDKSIADCVEALIGAYLLECGPRGALLFMSWLGIRVAPPHAARLHTPPRAYVHTQKTKPPPASDIPSESDSDSVDPDFPDSPEYPDGEADYPDSEEAPEVDDGWRERPVGSLRPYQDKNGQWYMTIFGELKAPPSPLLRYISDPEGELERMLSGYDALEETLQYRFKDRSLLLQALTHASHHSNTLTDCYQRLEFLGDAVLDYLITRHLYEDSRRHSPGALTDLRSALVNNTIFATLAARHGFHKYFRHLSPGLNDVLAKYVKIQEENGHSISEEHYLIQEDEMEQAEDVEVPKALGDLFESVAGAIFLDSGMSLGAVWRSYVNLMGAELEAFSAAAPKSPVRELLEAEPDQAKFGKPERLADGRRVRVVVEVFGRGAFKGVGRNYRIAKGTAARCALRHLHMYKR